MDVRSTPLDLERCHRAVTRLRQGSQTELSEWIRHQLFSDILPFWERHARDERGGILTCLADDGRVLSTDKWMWSQWRAVWVFSRIYNQLDRHPRWLAWGREIADFCLRSGWDAAGNGWALVLDHHGKILRGHESTYSDAFAIYALQELYKACGDEELLRAARQTADVALVQLAQPHDRLPHFPYSLPAGARAHGVPMMWSLVLAELGATTRDERYLAAAAALSTDIFSRFHRRDRDVLIEFIALDGSEFPAPHGTTVVPGHAIENMWFQVHVAQLTGRGGERESEAFRLILRHLELGWDYDHGGGILLAVDAAGGAQVGWDFPNTKLWWPHTEALYATLLGWKHTKNPVFLEWYQVVWNVCLDHFVDRANGEWRQKLDRNFAPLDQVVALPVKDPFHLPRSLILQLELLAGTTLSPTQAPPA